MVLRKGRLLEKYVERIFKHLGFSTEVNVRINGYEVDVYARKNGIRVICECKQYENAPLNVINLIHQWNSKNQEIKADRVLLVLYGVHISERAKEIASRKNIILWTEKNLYDYDDLIIKNSKLAEGSLYYNLRLKELLKEQPKIELKRQSTFLFWISTLLFIILLPLTIKFIVNYGNSYADETPVLYIISLFIQFLILFPFSVQQYNKKSIWILDDIIKFLDKFDKRNKIK